MSDHAVPIHSLNSGFVVAIQLEAKPGQEERLAAALQKLTPPSLAEPGIKVFLPYRSPSDSKQFFVYELYVDEAGWSAHQQTPHFKAFVEEMLPHLARRERVPFVPFVST